MEQFGGEFKRRREALGLSRRSVMTEGGLDHTNIMRIEAGTTASMRAAYMMLKGVSELSTAEAQRLLDLNLANRIADEVERWAIYRFLLDAPDELLARVVAALDDATATESPEDALRRVAEQPFPALARHAIATRLARQIQYVVESGTISAVLAPDVERNGADRSGEASG